MTSENKNTLLMNNRIIIPATLRHRILTIAHQQHQGIFKTIALLREKVWWPGLSRDTKEFIKSCRPCQSTTPYIVKYQPLKTTEIPKTSWHTLAIDIKGSFPCGTNHFS